MDTVNPRAITKTEMQLIMHIVGIKWNQKKNLKHLNKCKDITGSELEDSVLLRCKLFQNWCRESM